MNRIHVLTDQVANQIAAGEVVERPFNVVKELVENAIDAGATSIKVEIAAGGRSLIRVSDDGIGMSQDDALLALERHATSKISSADELFSISTMGFRGEALPSIASVSKFSLTTKERDSDLPEGNQIIVNAGKILKVTSAGCPPGTQIEARSLFFNLPARRKFLRTAETENGHVQNYLTLAAIAYPEIGWTFIRDGKEIWRLPAAGRQERLEESGEPGSWKTLAPWDPAQLDRLRERLHDLFGDTAERLVPIQAEGWIRPPAWLKRRPQPGLIADEDADDRDSSGSSEAALDPTPFRIWGFIGAPGVSRSNRNDMRLFVNRRPVDHRGLHHAILEGYHNALMKGRFPMTCLFLELDPSQVDINVHPAKKEVRFHQDREIRGELTRSIKATLTQFHTGEDASSSSFERHHHQQRQVEEESAIPQELWSQPITPLFQRAAGEDGGFEGGTDDGSDANTEEKGNRQERESGEVIKRPVSQPTSDPGGRRVLNVADWKAPSPLAPGTEGISKNEETSSSLSQNDLTGDQPFQQSAPKALSGPSPLLKTPMKLIGVVGNLYIILETDRGMALMDQHAAHERVLFEKTMKAVDAGPVASQRLLLPEMIEMSPRDAMETQEWLPVMQKLGIELRIFGERVFALDSMPSFVKCSDPKSFLLDVIDSLKRSGNWVSSARLGEEVLTKYVCRMAVKANDRLGVAELERLIEDLKECDMPYTCPHGRPTIIEMSYGELEKRFGRSV